MLIDLSMRRYYCCQSARRALLTSLSMQAESQRAAGVPLIVKFLLDVICL